MSSEQMRLLVIFAVLTVTSVCGARLPLKQITSLESGNKVFKYLKKGDTVSLSFDKLKLERTWVIAVDDVTLTGPKPSKKAVIECPDDGSAIIISATGVKLENIIFKNCKAAPAVQIGQLEVPIPSATAQLHNLEFTNNTVSNQFYRAGGATLSIAPGWSVSITLSVFRENSGGFGGAIHAKSGKLTVSDCDFTGNVARDGGGAIFTSGDLKVSNCGFVRNKSLFYGIGREPSTQQGRPREPLQWQTFPEPGVSGGAIMLVNSENVDIQTSDFIENSAMAGGAISATLNLQVKPGVYEKPEFVISKCGFFNNVANFTRDSQVQSMEDLRYGGAVFISVSSPVLTTKIKSSKFSGNFASFGGALHIVTLDENPVTVSDSQFLWNKAEMAGGGVLARNTGAMTWRGCKVKGNKAQFGGGLFLTNNAFFSISGFSRSFDGKVTAGQATVFEDNVAVDGGGLLCAACGVVVMQDPVFKNNRASRDGGGVAVHNALSEFFVQQPVVEGNLALRGGGALVDSVNHFRITSVPGTKSFITNNRAATGGGLFYAATSQPQNTVLLSDLEIASNEAVPYEDLSEELDEINEIVLPGGEPFLGFSDVTGFLGECGNGGAGGACVLLTDIPQRASADFTMKSVKVNANKASTAGGLFLDVEGDEWTGARCDTSTFRAASEAPCRGLRLNTVDLSTNGVVVTNPTIVPVTCAKLFKPGVEFNTLKDVFDTINNNPEAVLTERSCITL